MIFTIGYEKLNPARLQEIAEGLDALVVDCRHRPMSRHRGFGGRQLAALLGPRYEWRGLMLGGRGHTTAAGITQLRVEQETDCNVLLLCVEHEPARCHRTKDICTPHFPHAVHIFEDELILASDLQKAIDAAGGYPIAGSLNDLLLGRITSADLIGPFAFA